MKGKYLITTNDWFYAPDGKKYRSVWGDVEILSDSLLGVETNRNSTNWYAKVGSEENHAIIAGCHIHYAIKCNEKPNSSRIVEIQYNENGVREIERDCEIYIAE